VISKVLYDEIKRSGNIYTIENSLSCTDFYMVTQVPEPFIRTAELDKKAEEDAKCISLKRAVNITEAKELVAAKSLGAKLAISAKQLWLQKAAKAEKVNIETM